MPLRFMPILALAACTLLACPIMAQAGSPFETVGPGTHTVIKGTAAPAPNNAAASAIASTLNNDGAEATVNTPALKRGFGSWETPWMRAQRLKNAKRSGGNSDDNGDETPRAAHRTLKRPVKAKPTGPEYN